MKLPKGAHPKFILASIRERILFEQFYQKQKDFDIELVSDVIKFESWDAIINSANTKFITEIKIRPKTLEWDEWFLQEDKYKSLTAMTSTDRALTLGTKCLYLNVFEDGVIYWEIDVEKNLTFNMENLPKTTAGSKELVNKRATKLMNKDGTIIRYNTNIKEATEQAKQVFRFLFPGVQIPK